MRRYFIQRRRAMHPCRLPAGTVVQSIEAGVLWEESIAGMRYRVLPQRRQIEAQAGRGRCQDAQKSTNHASAQRHHTASAECPPLMIAGAMTMRGARCRPQRCVMRARRSAAKCAAYAAQYECGVRRAQSAQRVDVLLFVY